MSRDSDVTPFKTSLTFHASPAASTAPTLSPGSQSRRPQSPAARRRPTGWRTRPGPHLQGKGGEKSHKPAVEAQAEPTRGVPQLHVHEVFVVIKKFGPLHSVQDGPGAVDPTGYHGNAGKSDALKSSNTGFNPINDRSNQEVTHLSHGGGAAASPPPRSSSSTQTSARTCIWTKGDSRVQERLTGPKQT